MKNMKIRYFLTYMLSLSLCRFVFTFGALFFRSSPLRFSYPAPPDKKNFISKPLGFAEVRNPTANMELEWSHAHDISCGPRLPPTIRLSHYQLALVKTSTQIYVCFTFHAWLECMAKWHPLAGWLLNVAANLQATYSDALTLETATVTANTYS